MENDKKHAYLKDNGTLRHPLRLRDSQEGFVGVTGEMIEIRPDGVWTVKRFVNDKLAKPHGEGKLPPDAVRQLSQLLQDQEFLELPESFGKDVPINRHLVELSFGPERTTLTLVGGESLADVKLEDTNSQAGMWKRFRCIANAIMKIAATHEEKPRNLQE
jgi:hypothetical protein